ncbi:MAG: nucleotidyltransferase [Vicinamibacteraceae bacterium]
MRSPVADLLADLSSAFAASQVDWYLFGAQAAIVYGVARLTADVDVTVRTPDRLPIASLVESLERSGFLQRIPDPVFAAQSRVLPFVHQATRLPVDVVLAGPGIEDEFLARARRHVIDGVDVPVVDVTDLIVMKVLAGRPKDLEDVVTLLRVQETAVDTRRTLHLLQMLESALAQSDLLPAFEQALARAGSKAK